MAKRDEEIMVAACRPVRPEDYPPDRLKIWNDTVVKLGLTPPLYPGSIYQDCEGCGIEVAVGPRTQDMIRARDVVVMCMLCATTEAIQPGVSASLRHLGNPFSNPTN